MKASGQQKTIQALIGLIDDPDDHVFEKIKQELMSIGTEAVPLLELAWENTFDSDQQKRIENIIHDIQFQQLTIDFTQWSAFYRNDLLKGYLLVTRYQYPELNEGDIIARIEQFRWNIWLEINDNLTALEIVRVVNHVVFDQQQFGANKTHPNALQNFFLNNLLESKRGNPLSLGILYLILCSRLHLPVYGVDLPQHFVLAYTDDLRIGDTLLRSENSKVLFYINAYRKGSVFNAADIEEYLAELKMEPQPSYFRPADTVSIIKALIISLQSAYKQFNMMDKVRDLEVLLSVIS